MFRYLPRVAMALMIPVAILFLATPHAVKAQDTNPFVSPMFSDNMVLQRGMADPVWGWASPGTKITVQIGDQKASTTANRDGKWQTKVGPLEVGGPYTMTITGPKTVTFSNILVGDVWICSGQSNMEMGIGNVNNAEEEMNSGDYPKIRLFAQPRLVAGEPVQATGGSWQVCSPTALRTDGIWGGFSATGYFFGRKLHQDLGVPIGLIHTSWGGTVAQAWTNAKELGDKLPEFRPFIQQLDEARKQKLVAQKTKVDPFAAWYAKNDKGSSTTPGWESTNLDDSGWKSAEVPGFFQKSGYPEFDNVMSVVWYRKTVEVPQGATGEATLKFLADDNDTAWVNGVKVGSTDGYNIPRKYKVPAGVLKPGKNVIAIRVTDTSAPGGIYGDPTNILLETSESAPIALRGQWKLKLGTVITAQNPLPATIQDNPNFPTVLYNGMIYPIIPFGIKGAIWYQGESNAGQAYQYRTLLPTMIQSWRNTWHEGDFPFYIVQLAGFGAKPDQPGNDAWAELREAQWMTAQSVRNAGIATAIDIGESRDIHPKNKQEVGRRLALVAEAQAFKMPVEAFGPVYRSMKVEGSKIRLNFNHAEGGLSAKNGPLIGFAIAGDDHKWYWADAQVDGNTVVVSSSNVPHPVAVRYSWATYYESNLYNQAGLPAFPFRTDNWPGITGGPKK